MSEHIADWPGTPLKSADFKQGKVLLARGAPNAKYAWDCGVGIGVYFEGLKDGKLVGAKMPDSGRTVIPPRAFDEIAFTSNVEFVDLPDTGTINTFSLAHVTWDVQRLAKPQIPAVIDVDGTEPRCGIMHMIGEVKPEHVRIGMRVKAVWKPAAERTGQITDIKYWKPVKE